MRSRRPPPGPVPPRLTPAPPVRVRAADVAGATAEGRPLDPAARVFFEARFGHDLRRIRIHDDARADRSARAVDAAAYTAGPHIAFTRGAYAPGTEAGRRLLAHELAHAVQQRGASPGSSIAVAPHGDRAEREADRAAEHVLRGEASPPLTAVAGPLLQRNPPTVPPTGPPVIGGLPDDGTYIDLYRYASNGQEGVRPNGWWTTRRAEGANLAAQITGVPAQECRFRQHIRVHAYRLEELFGQPTTRSTGAGTVNEYRNSMPIEPSGMVIEGLPPLDPSLPAPAAVEIELPAHMLRTTPRVRRPAAPLPFENPPAALPAEPVVAPVRPAVTPRPPIPTARLPTTIYRPPNAPVVPEPIRPAVTPSRPPPTRPTGGGGGGATGGSLAGGLLRGLLQAGVEALLLYLVARAFEEAERARVEALYRRDVDPEAARRLTAATPAIDALLLADPYAPIYANVTVLVVEITSAVRSHPNTSVGAVSVADLEVSREPRAGQERLATTTDVVSTTYVRQRTSWNVRYAVPLDLDRTGRAAAAAAAAVAAHRTARDALAGRQWSDAQVDEYLALYRAAAAGDAALVQGVDVILRERNRIANATLRYGRSAALAAHATAESGMTVRQGAAQTHWASPAERLGYVDAYLEITRDVPAWSALHADAARYRDQLTPIDPALLRYVRGL